MLINKACSRLDHQICLKIVLDWQIHSFGNKLREMAFQNAPGAKNDNTDPESENIDSCSIYLNDNIVTLHLINKN